MGTTDANVSDNFDAVTTATYAGGTHATAAPVTVDLTEDITDEGGNHEQWEDEDLKGIEDWTIKSRDLTRTHVRAFIKSQEQNCVIELNIRPLEGEKDFLSWYHAMALQLRILYLWEVVEGTLTGLPPLDILYSDWQHMRDVASGVIFKHVSQPLRETDCFLRALRERCPAFLMRHLFNHYWKERETAT
ncbi:hypothetical protein N7454_006027 [Penicillium verhagenii]|nr:hypothetical protein N7454_006027 [Penicillium verhagenii]